MEVKKDLYGRRGGLDYTEMEALARRYLPVRCVPGLLFRCGDGEDGEYSVSSVHKKIKNYGIKKEWASHALKKEIKKTADLMVITSKDFKTLCKEALGKNYNEEKVDSELNALFSEASKRSARRLEI